MTGMAFSEGEHGDVEAGKTAFRECKSCHMVGKGAKHRIGPNLNGIFGRKAADQDGFRYSKPLKRAGVNGLEWHAETLNDYIENPRQMVTGTRMSYRGMKDPEKRRNLIAYLRTFSDDPANIPEADPTAVASDHDLDPAILAIVGDPEYGAYLSGECTTCHKTAGDDQGIPNIVHWPVEDFVIALHAYKSKKRPHPVMQMVAARLGDEEIAALAAYFSNLEEN